MEFTELNRCFVPIGKEQEPNLDLGLLWGRKIGGWLGWKDLLEYRRVVLLAEALSGKTEEFLHQASTLFAENQSGFFLRIEDLADGEFEEALYGHASRAFTSWLTGTGVGWFFLDSIDEARLNRKSFERALKRFAHKLDHALERARVFISCRMSDWKGHDDSKAIEQYLPIWETPKSPPDEDRALLSPIFESKQERTSQPSQEPARKCNELLVVQLVPLSDEQRHALAMASGVQNVDHFVAAIDRHGLDVLAERPGDLLELAGYWKTYGSFDTLARMTDHGITVKLSERDKYRPDNDTLSLHKAREGAERLAAALTLGQSLTLRTPGEDPDPSLAAGALDPVMILDDWTDAERNALLRRGIFVPATYGRVRFHHRSTQEYLTAQWFIRLLHANCPQSEIWHLLFANRYGVETVVPSLRPAAAWLAMDAPAFRDEIMRREPLVLLRHGDPGSLPLKTRKQLLHLYAMKHARGEIADDHLDYRLLWMFADKELGDAIHEAWHLNERTDFRIDLLQLIAAGIITRCIDLARSVAYDEDAEGYARVAALRALKQCGDQEGLAHAAKQLMANPSHATARVAASLAPLLYPCALTTEELLTLMTEAQPARQSTSEGFPYAIKELYAVCPDAAARSQFLSGLAELCLLPPFAADYHRVSIRYGGLAQHLAAITRQALQELADHDPPRHLVRLLMAVERAEHLRLENDEPEIAALVQANVKLNRALFWADVEEVRAHSPREPLSTRYQSVFFGGPQLWHLRPVDLPWLYEDLAVCGRMIDQQIALSSIVEVLRLSGQLDTELDRLRALVAGRPPLQEDLDAYLAPPQKDEEIRQLEHEHIRSQQQRDEATEQAKASWVRLREKLRSDPAQLYNPGHLSTAAGVMDLQNLTGWLTHRTQIRDEKRTVLQWRLLEEGFGQAVAEGYRRGMKALWRITEPEHTTRHPDGSMTVKWCMILSYAGIALEAAEEPDCASHLSASEAALAAQHSCMADQGYPEWIDVLALSHPQEVLPILQQTLVKAWLSERPDFLYHYANSVQPIPHSVQRLLFEIIVGDEPHDLHRLDTGLGILQYLELNDKDRLQIAGLAEQRLRHHTQAGQNNHALRYLAFLLLVDPQRGMDELTAWIETPQGEAEDQRTEQTLGVLFGRHAPLAAPFLNHVSVGGLEALLRQAYRYIHLKDDVVHEGTYTPNARDHAEDARSVILQALLDRPGEEAYRALLHLSEDPHVSVSMMRFRELARGKAERDAEAPTWSVAEILNLERRHSVAVKTGTDLLRVVMTVLNDIRHDFVNADASSRRVLEKAEDENAVQNWLAEQLRLRARGRFHVHREVEVAEKKEPDIIVSSTTALCEVAIEVKHANKGWTVQALDTALQQQLASDYLRLTSRRHGVFVISFHEKRTWYHPETKGTLSFDALLSYLTDTASTLVMHEAGHPIEVRIMGIDASPNT